MRIRLILAALCLAVLSGCQILRPPRGVDPVARTMTVTGYCRCGQCCSWHRTWYGKPVYSSGAYKGKRKRIGMTASGTMARKGTIAADTSLYPMGTIMYVEGYGYGRVEDRGGKIRGEHIDLFFATHKQAREWGKQTKVVDVWILGK